MKRLNNLPAILKERFNGNQIQKINDYIYGISENTKNLPQKFDKSKLVILISGPSGSGKDSIVDLLPSSFLRIRTCTTRQIRPEEIGKDPYLRLTLKEFEEGITNQEFLETNLYDGNYYGSKISEINKVISLGKIPILRIDPTGAKNAVTITKQTPNVLNGLAILYFYITPPSEEILKQRIFKRDVENVLDLKKRKEAEEKAINRFEGTVLKDLELSKHAHFIAINFEGKLKEVTENILKTFNSYL
jgi:guanylate kinase